MKNRNAIIGGGLLLTGISFGVCAHLSDEKMNDAHDAAIVSASKGDDFMADIYESNEKVTELVRNVEYGIMAGCLGASAVVLAVGTGKRQEIASPVAETVD